MAGNDVTLLFSGRNSVSNDNPLTDNGVVSTLSLCVLPEVVVDPNCVGSEDAENLYAKSSFKEFK